VVNRAHPTLRHTPLDGPPRPRLPPQKQSGSRHLARGTPLRPHRLLLTASAALLMVVDDPHRLGNRGGPLPGIAVDVRLRRVHGAHRIRADRVDLKGKQLLGPSRRRLGHERPDALHARRSRGMGSGQLPGDGLPCGQRLQDARHQPHTCGPCAAVTDSAFWPSSAGVAGGAGGCRCERSPGGALAAATIPGTSTNARSSVCSG
jgi:hypothetical protein